MRSAPRAKQARRLSLAATGPGSLLREGDRVLVAIGFDHGAAAAVRDLRNVGARVLEVSPRYQQVAAEVKPADLQRLTGLPRVRGVSEVLAPITSAVTPCFGDATSEGDVQLEAAKAREEFGVDGSGVTVGILSDSFDRDSSAPTGAIQDIASGDLPGIGNTCEREAGVEVLDDTEKDGADEGRAMAQIVHDVAPSAKLAFATAFKKTMFGFADNIRKLAEPVASGGAGADVIVDDVSYFEEPFFQEGPVGVAVREVTEEDINYFSSAGNNNLRNGSRNFASWEAPEFRDASPTSCPAGLPGYVQHCMDFNPGAEADTDFAITVSPKSKLSIDLQWAQPWEGVTTDLDAYLVNAAGELMASSENFNVTSTQIPFEFFSWTNPSSNAQTVRMAIDRCAATCDPENGGDTGTPLIKFALLQNGAGVQSTEYETSTEGGDVVGPTIFGHNGAKDAMSVGAIRYNETAKPESFSSRGPVSHYFGPADGISPATELPSPPEILDKPDIVATDGGANTFFGACSLGAWRFFGTSAAAPHAAAVAALEREAEPSASAEQIAQAQRDGASAVGEFPAEAVGSGLISAIAAIEALGVSPVSPGASPTPPPAPVSCLNTDPEPEDEPRVTPVPVPIPSPEESPVTSSPAGDRTAPRTGFRRKPPRVLRTRWRRGKAVFRFRSNERGVDFLCQFDRKRYRPCGLRFVRWFLRGRHVLRVRARDAAGNVDRTPAVHRFRVKQVSRRAFRRRRGA